MNADLITNGGIRVTLRAHAVCGHCTECADLQTEEVADGAEFAAMAEDHFKGMGWKFVKGKKVRCPTCSSKRAVKRDDTRVGHVKGCELGSNWKDCPACVANAMNE